MCDGITELDRFVSDWINRLRVLNPQSRGILSQCCGVYLMLECIWSRCIYGDNHCQYYTAYMSTAWPGD